MNWQDIPKNTCGIYCYTNLINNKSYVGQSINLRIRLRDHERNFTKSDFSFTSCGENKLLWSAVLKYGRENFSIKILELCSDDAIDDRERFYIKSINSHVSGHGYNITWGGESTRGIILDDIARKNISQSKIGNKNPFFGKQHSKESRDQISKWRLDNFDVWYKSGKDHPNFGKRHSDESIKKMSKLQSAQGNGNYGKKKLSASSKYYGVMYNSRRKNWVSIVKYLGKKIYVAQGKSEIDVARAYNKYIIDNNIPYVLNVIKEK